MNTLKLGSKMKTIQISRSDDEPIPPSLRALGALVALYGNDDSFGENLAANAAGDGRASYWNTQRTNNPVAGIFRDRANTDGLAAAIVWVESRGKPATEVAGLPFLLGSLIPLNQAARKEIVVAYHWK